MTAAVRSLLHLSLLLALSMVVSGCLPDSAEPDAADSATDSDKTAGKGRKGRGGGGADARRLNTIKNIKSHAYQTHR